MDRDLEHLAALHQEAPDDPAPALAYARGLERAGDPTRAFAVLDVLLDRAEHAEARARWWSLVRAPLLPEPAPPRLLHREEAPVRDMAFDAAGTRLVVLAFEAKTRSSPNRVVTLDLEPDARVRQATPLTAHRWPAYAVDLSPDGATIATCGEGGLRAFTVATGSRVAALAADVGRGGPVALRGGEVLGNVPDDARGLRAATTQRLPLGPGTRGAAEPAVHPEVLLAGRDPATRREHAAEVEFFLHRVMGRSVGAWHSTRSLRTRAGGAVALVEDRRGTGVAAFQLTRVADLEFEPTPTRRSLELDAPRPSLSTWGQPSRPFARATGGVAMALSQGHHWDEELHRRSGAGLRLILPGEPPRHLFVAHPEEVTALAFSPSGGRLAIGTLAGEVLVMDLRAPPRRSPTRRRAEPLTATPSLDRRDLRDPGPGPAAAATVLRHLPAPRLQLTRPALVFTEEALWLVPDPRAREGTVRLALGPTRVQEVRVQKLGWRLELATGEAATLAAPEVGPVFRALPVPPGGAPPLERDRSVLAEPIVDAPPPPPHQRPSKPRKPPWARSLATASGVRWRAWYPAPAGSLWALQASRRPREVWVADGAAPEAGMAHVVCPHDVRQLAWSPRGGRLGALLANGTVMVIGADPELERNS